MSPFVDTATIAEGVSGNMTVLPDAVCRAHGTSLYDETGLALLIRSRVAAQALPLLPFYASELPVVPQRPGTLHKQRYFSRSRFPEPDLLAPSPPLLLNSKLFRTDARSDFRVVFSLLSS